MQGTIAQIVALVLFGNQYLSGTPVTDFWPNSSIFQFDATVRFVILSGQRATRVETEIAPDPMAWFEWLKAEGIIGLRLHFAPKSKTLKEDRMQAGFVGGGGRWVIEAIRDTQISDFWEARWQLGDRNAPDRKIWNVTYVRIAERDNRRAEIEPPLAKLQADIDKVLGDIATFADQHEKAQFAASFRRGQELLHDEHPLAEGYHSEFVRSSRLSLAAAQLLGTAVAAWVFGGMGSWNDMSFKGEEQKQYDELSDALFVLLARAITASANSTLPGAALQQPTAAPDPLAPTKPAEQRGWLWRLLGRG